MHIDYSEEQVMLEDSAKRYLDDHYDFDQRRKILQSLQSFSAEHWKKFAELGWLAMPLREESGGFGGGAIENMLLCEQFGRHLVLEPYLETVVLGAALLEERGSDDLKQRYLPALIEGDLQVAVAHLESRHTSSIEHVETLAWPRGDSFLLSGEKAVVYNGDAADIVIVSARVSGDEGISLFVVPSDAAGLQRRSYKTYDGHGACELRLDNVEVSAEQLLGRRGEALWYLEKVLSRGLCAIAAEAIGAMDALLEKTVEYTRQRQQFGRPIAQFQVLRHRMADMFMEIELSRSLLMATAWKLDHGAEDVERCLNALKVKIGKAAKFVGHNAIQLHGGIGTTDELSIGHYFKRLMATGVLFGSRDTHLLRFFSHLKRLN